MQKNRDLKGESRIFNKCVNAGTNRVAREFVLPVLLGVAALPVALELGPIACVTHFNRVALARMGINLTSQCLVNLLTKGNINEIDYLSVLAEGFSFGGSVIASFIEITPHSADGPLKVAFINKNVTDSTIDIILGTTAGVLSKTYNKEVFKDAFYHGDLEDKIFSGTLVSGVYMISQTAYGGFNKFAKYIGEKISDEDMVRSE